MKNKQKKAAAIKYEQGKSNAPRMVAKGRGLMADKIVELAKEFNIPIKEDKELVEMLSALELNDEIPPELYKAVAEILAFIYRLHNKK